MPLQQVSALINILVYIYDAHQHVLQFLSLRELRIYGTTCKDIHLAVEEFVKKEYDIDTYLTRFLLKKDIYTFCEVQRMTKTIISGSIALQFFARLNFPSCDMDLYTPSKEASFMCRCLELFGCVAKAKDGSETTAVALLDASWRLMLETPVNGNSLYGPRGILTVVNFSTPTGRLIQVIVTIIPPVEVLMGYHSSEVFSLSCIIRCSYHTSSAAVMNFITSTHAYSLYGWETFDLGLSLYTRHHFAGMPQVVAKYTRRGWKPLTNGSQAADYMVFKPMSRSVGDRITWKLRLKLNYSDGFEKPRPVGSLDVKERAMKWFLSYDIMGFPILRPQVVTHLPVLAPL
ncbi:hypothetical protein PC9H_008413 [Pleurotus ostreatus]|uniref:Uncharacterized protein n=1 Tax=Pleurotus ostreatus TaxID=5322 RepID=A0A8H7DRL3_PLEOS|nr:uncharacterized protein PC9H_008413 [Pleurotus ostreatus]KAF7426048.1 hypothetical protein PC9H_008413 [Pleurotus ostreatus]KAJ8693469.1 hypothetical protein PTI98_008457 [Pleurotus ostreatus]